MADSLLDLYLGSGEKKIAPEKEQSSSLMDTYLGTQEASGVPTPAGVPRITVTPKVPISDNPQEQQQFEKALTERQPEKSIAAKAMALPVDAAIGYGQDVYRHASNAGQMFSEGVGELGTNRSASGLGKTVLGAAGVPLSLITAPLEELTKFGDKVTGKATPGLPTDIVGNPLSDKPFTTEGPTGMALSGLPVGKALAALGKNAFAVAAPLRSSITTNKAIAGIVDTIGVDKIADVVRELKSNDRLSLMDVVPATRQMAQKLITNEGPHQNKFEKFVTDRVASGKDATSNIYDSTMGTPVNIVDKVNALKQAAKDVGKKEIQPAVDNAGFVDVSNVIKNIDAKLKPGVNSVISAGEPLALGDIEKPLAAVRQFIMDEKSVRTDPKSLHQLQSALRAKAEDLLNSTDGQNRQKGYALMGVRNDIVNAIDDASPKISANPIPEKFRDIKLDTPSGKTDVTGVWFLDGDKPIYSSTQNGAKQLLGKKADELNNYSSITKKDADGNPITVWYKPGEKAKAEFEAEKFADPNKFKGDINSQIKYHVEGGRNLGYPDASVDSYVRKRFGDEAVNAAGYKNISGSYKPALSKFRDEKQVENAFNMGQLVTRNKLGRLEDSPEFWDNWVKAASPQELEAAKEGARLAMQHQISGFKAGARKGQDIVESEFNRDKLSSLFGEKEVDKMAKSLQDERNIAITNSKLIDNSQTAMRMKADSRVDLPVRKEGSIGVLGAPILELANMASGSGVPGLGAAAYLGAKGASAAKFKYVDLPLAKVRNSKITDLLTATGEDRADLIRILESHIQQPKLSLANKARLALPTTP